MDHSLNSLYYDLMQSEMSDSQHMSLWANQPMYKTSSQPASTCSTPSTPPYSLSLDLERKMLEPPGPSSCKMMQPGPMTVIAGADSRHHPVAVNVGPPPLIATNMSHISAQGTSGTKRVGRKNFVDPCTIAPLKKRRIQVEMLSPDDREKVLQKREKNKIAAERCRIKRRENSQRIRAEYEEYLEANESLEADIHRLKEERQMLQDLLDNHHCVLKLQA